MTIAAAASVAIATLLASLIPALKEAVTSSFGPTRDGRVEVSAVPVNPGNLDTRISPTFLASLSMQPNVLRVDRAITLIAIDSTGHRIEVNAGENTPFAFRIARGRGQESFDRGEIMIGTGLARRRHLRPGSILRLPTPTGFVNLRVGGVWSDPSENGNSVIMSMSLLTSIWGDQQPSVVFVRPARGVTPVELARQIRTAGLYRDLRVRAPSQAIEELSTDSADLLSPFWVLQRGFLIVAFAATLSTLLLVSVERQREFGFLAAVGMSPSQLAKMNLTEAVAVGVLGSLLGLVAGLALFQALRQAIPVLIGFYIPFRVDLLAAGFYGLVTTVILLAGAGWPARRLASLEVVDAIRTE
jgi:ABC-type antimicrobial peptide transport system permease subunit